MMRFLLCMGMLLAFGAGAEATTVRIAGQITHTTLASGSDLAMTFTAGEQYVMTYEWSGPGAPAQPPGSGVTATYLNAGNSMSFSTDDYWITGSTVSYALGLLQGVYSRVDVSSRWYQTASSPVTPLTYPTLLDGRFPYYVGIQLDDPTGTSLTSLNLEGPLFDLSAFPARQMEIAFALQITPGAADGVARVLGTVDSMVVLSAVPEPGALELALLGFVVVIGVATIHRRSCPSR